MRRNERAFRPADPQVPAPVRVWLAVVLLLFAVGGASALFVIVTGENPVR